MHEAASVQDVVRDVAIIVGKRQLRRLQRVVERHRSGPDAGAAERLDAALRRAIVVPQALVPAAIVTIGSVAGFEDVETGARASLIPCCPEDADAPRGRVSILEPLATALFGAAAGEIVEWTGPDGRIRRTRVTAVSPVRGQASLPAADPVAAVH
jgi:regulator of nucleoside diphosphate kinase